MMREQTISATDSQWVSPHEIRLRNQPITLAHLDSLLEILFDANQFDPVYMVLSEVDGKELRHSMALGSHVRCQAAEKDLIRAILEEIYINSTTGQIIKLSVSHELEAGEVWLWAQPKDGEA